MKDFNKESVKLDQILKYLFTVSKSVLVKLLNGIFNEDYESDEVELSVSNSEFVGDELGILRGDVFFEIEKQEKHTYHIEFQTKNDSTMIIRMFEYGLNKGKEKLNSTDKPDNLNERVIYFPKQKIIFIEENRNIPDEMKIKIIMPDGEELVYKVSVMKYWEYSDKDLIEKQMYPLLPLQLFKLRKDLKKAHDKNDIKKLKSLAAKTKSIAIKLSNESSQLFEEEEILGADFHKMLLAIQNLVEYLNRNFIEDEDIEEEVIKVTKTLFDPEVEKRGINKGIEQGIEQGIERGMEIIVLKQLKKKFEITEADEERVKALKEDRLEALAEAILDFEVKEDLDKFLG